MTTCVLQFNLYLLTVAFVLGCRTMGNKEAATLRFHLEVNRDGTKYNGPVMINRSTPFAVNVERAPFLTEGNIIEAAVVEDSLGGFQIKVQFDRRGTWLLEQYTIASKGKHIAIFSQFGEARWLAAPILERRVSDGAFAFTPDASREEADRIVRGLNAVGKEVKKRNR